jgi:hypothetical protein
LPLQLIGSVQLVPSPPPSQLTAASNCRRSSASAKQCRRRAGLLPGRFPAVARRTSTGFHDVSHLMLSFRADKTCALNLCGIGRAAQIWIAHNRPIPLYHANVEDQARSGESPHCLHHTRALMELM